MKIRLNEIPEEGRAFQFDRKGGELDLALDDLIGERGYDVDLFIRPIGNAYEMRGRVKASLGEICSKCGYDFDLPVDRAINEILFEEQPQCRKGHSVHGNGAIDYDGEGPSMTPYKGDVFEADKYVHEIIALSEPFYPICGVNGNCVRADEAEEIRKKLEAEYNRAAEEELKPSPFSVLKGLDLKKKN